MNKPHVQHGVPFWRQTFTFWEPPINSEKQLEYVGPTFSAAPLGADLGRVISEVFQNNEMCCDKTCAKITCDAGFSNKGASVVALTHDECCDALTPLCAAIWSALFESNSESLC